MAKAPYKHPSVFVACPYVPKAQFQTFRAALRRVPLEFHYADSSIKTQYVMDRIRRGIIRTDFSLFDITNWNANVTLELGLAEGLSKNYYILFKPGRKAKSEPPSDIKGLQRFQYKRVDGFDEDCLTFQLNHQLVKRLAHPRYIYDHLTEPNRDKTFVVAMRILAHFKNHKVLYGKDLQTLARGSYLRASAKKELLQLLRSRQLIKGKPDGNKWTPARALYKNVSF